jgi:hypothetical protein
MIKAALALACLAAAPAAATEDPDGANRLFWVVPNYRTVEEDKLIVPLTTKEKFTIAAKDSFDPYAFPVAGVFAGIAYAADQDESSWGGRGPTGYGRRYAATFADQTVSNFMAEGVFPTLLHEDPRYFRLGRGGFWRRTGYAVSRVFATRTDHGGQEFNYSEFGGNAVMAVAGDAYYPRPERTAAAAASRWGIQIGMDIVFNVAKEFWPDIRRGLTGK